MVEEGGGRWVSGEEEVGLAMVLRWMMFMVLRMRGRGLVEDWVVRGRGLVRGVRGKVLRRMFVTVLIGHSRWSNYRSKVIENG